MMAWVPVPWLLALAWSNPGHYKHLGSEPVDGSELQCFFVYIQIILYNLLYGL